MTLKQFYGYTQDEAIQQAQELYGDNFVVLKITEPTQEGGLVGVSIIIEPQNTPREVPQESSSTSTSTSTSTSLRQLPLHQQQLHQPVQLCRNYGKLQWAWNRH
jgi:flagellar biosynthesis GTPase FlhF